MKKIISVVLLASLATMPLSAEVAKKESIKLLMDKTGSTKMAKQMIGQIIPNLKLYAPDAPDSFWEEVVADIDMNHLAELVIPIYQKNLTEQDVQDINTFYDTPAGKKLIRVMPTIMQETIKVGQIWGQEIGKDVFKKLKEKKYIK